MGASRKLQGEIDRVLKKVQEGVDVFDSIWNKVYDTENVNQKEKFEADLKKEIKKLQRYRDQIKTWIQSSEIKDKKALMDARKQIEREMERFKVCEKETKTKAFSKEGLGQQPKTDPKERAKSETRDWLNNAVGDLTTQIESFEAEIEAVSVKKGKSRPSRLVNLETSVVRHKAHIMKLELILRLLDNDELSPEQVNDVKDFLEDYVERNQDDFDEFSDVDEFYVTLPLEKVESLEELVASGPSVLVKGIGSISTASAGLGLKGPLATSPTQEIAGLASPSQRSNSAQDQSEETASQDSTTDVILKTPPTKTGTTSLVSSTSTSIASGSNGNTTLAASSSITSSNLIGDSPATSVISNTSGRIVLDNSLSTAPPVASYSSSVKNDDHMNLLVRRSSPAPGEIPIGRGVGRSIGLASSQVGVSMNLGSTGSMTGSGAFGAIPAASDIVKRNTLGSDESTELGNLSQTLVSPLANRMLLQPGSKSNDGIGSADNVVVGEGVITGGRVFSSSGVTGTQWRPPNLNSFQNQNESGQVRGRTEITPDQREKYIERLQKVKQHPSNLLGSTHLSGANQQFQPQQQNSLLQQFNSQSLPAQIGLSQSLILANAKLASQQQLPNSVHPQMGQQASFSTGSRDSDVGHTKAEVQVQTDPSEEFNVEPLMSSGSNMAVVSDDDLKSPSMAETSASLTENNKMPRDTVFSPGQPLPSNQSSANLGVIGRRSISDLGAIGDNISGSVGNQGALHDQVYNLQMLDAAFHKLPQPKDSERVKNYIPRRPAVTPSSYPQVQAPIVDNPAFWERLGVDTMGTDTLFFAFYYQQNTYQQYLAAKELKRQSWRYHRKFHTWFQRHEEPKITTDDYEQGTYVYFDFHIGDDNMQHGWCQRIKTDFTFEYSYLEDELVV